MINLINSYSAEALEDDEFLSNCKKMNETDYVFGVQDGVQGMYRESTHYLSKTDAIHMLLETKNWVTQSLPSDWVSQRPGSYFFMLDVSSEGKKDLTSDWLKPWSSVGKAAGHRITPKWEKFPAPDGVNCVRVSKSRHPRFTYTKRMMVFLCDVDGNVASNVFYQYVIEHQDNPNVDVSFFSQKEVDYSDLLESTVSPPTNLTTPGPSHQSTSFQQPKVFNNRIPQSLEDPFDGYFSKLVNKQRNIHEQLTKTKRQYCDASDIDEMRRIGTKCEKLLLLEKTIQKKVEEIYILACNELKALEDDEPPVKTLKLIKEEE